MKSSVPGSLYLHEMYGFPASAVPGDAQLLAMGRAVANVAAADGVLSDAEREQLLTMLAACGAGQAVLDAIATHAPDPEDVARHLAEAAPIPPRVLLYEAIRTAYADRLYVPSERRAVLAMAEVLGVGGEVVELIEHLIESERTLREMRIALLSPGAEDLGGTAPGTSR